MKKESNCFVIGFRNCCNHLQIGGFGRAVIALSSATVLTQAVSVALSPVYARLYSPSDFGLFSVYSSVVSSALTIGSLSYEVGIPVAKHQREAMTLTILAILIAITTALLALGVLVLSSISGVPRVASQLHRYLWLVPIGIALSGIFRAVRYWALRRRAIAAIASTSVSQMVGSNIFTLGFGVLYPGPLGLMLGAIIANCAGVCRLARSTRLPAYVRAGLRHFSALSQLGDVGKKYRRLPLVSSPSALLNSLGLYLPGMLVAPWFGSSFAGQFFMAMRMASLPINLIGTALSHAFLSSAAVIARERPKDLNRFFHRVFFRAIGISLVVPVFGLASPRLVPAILGEQWREAGEIAFWFSLYLPFALSVSALSWIPSIAGRLRGQLIIDSGRGAAVLTVLFIVHSHAYSSMWVVKLYTLVQILNYSLCFLLYRRQVKLISCTGQTNWHAPDLAI